jgi:hypothetical protein
VCRSYGSWAEGRETAWRWLTANHQQLKEVIGSLIGPHLPWLASGFCSEADRDRVMEYFGGLDEVAPGTERNLRLAGEYISQCARMRATYQDKLSEYLSER